MNRIRHNYPSLIRCLRVFHILVLAYLLFRCYCYNHYKIPKTLLLLSLLLLLLPPLSYYFATKHFTADTKFPGVVELTTQLLILENILWPPCVESTNLGWMLYPQKLLRCPILVGYQDYFLAPLPGSIALFFESLGIYICWSLWRTWKTIKLKFIPQLRWEVRNCHLALH